MTPDHSKQTQAPQPPDKQDAVGGAELSEALRLLSASPDEPGQTADRLLEKLTPSTNPDTPNPATSRSQAFGKPI